MSGFIAGKRLTCAGRTYEVGERVDVSMLRPRIVKQLENTRRLFRDDNRPEGRGFSRPARGPLVELGGGWYGLPDGNKVRGLSKAKRAQQALAREG